MWEENNFAVSLRVKRGHGYFLLASLTVPVSGIFSSFDRVARNVPLDEEMNNVRSMGPDRPNNANLCPKKWWRYIFMQHDIYNHQSRKVEFYDIP